MTIGTVLDQDALLDHFWAASFFSLEGTGDEAITDWGDESDPQMELNEIELSISASRKIYKVRSLIFCASEGIQKVPIHPHLDHIAS